VIQRTERLATGAAALALTLALTAAAMGARGAQGVASAAVPRTSWGEPDLSGIWLAVTPGAGVVDTFNLAQLERLYTSEARATISKLTASDDPIRRCYPPLFPRAVILGKPIQIVQTPGLVVVLTEALHSFRVIPSDGRPRREDLLFPTYLGDSVAKWDGDTLVVDVVSFNGEGWLANPRDKPSASSTGVWPTSPELHVIERWRRIDADTLEYRATVEDPGVLTGPWQTAPVRFTRETARRIEVEKCFVDEPSTWLQRE
jgi:hypothetical protein